MKRRTALLLLCGLATATSTMGLLTGFVPQSTGPELRRQASNVVVSLRPEDIPESIVPHGDGVHQWAVRSRIVTTASVGPTQVFYSAQASEGDETPATPEASGTDPTRIITFEPAGVRLITGEHETSLHGNMQGEAFPLLAVDDASAPTLLGNQPLQYGDVFDASGRPLRWDNGEGSLLPYAPGSPRQALAALKRKVTRRTLELLTAERARPGNADHYRQLVEQCSNRYNLNTALVYAIIHSESNFSTTLVSNRSAMGLMQILPGTASGEIHRFLYGHSGSVGFAELSEPEVNIRYGTAYLHILLTRYFGGVHDTQAREYCAVAAYNMGPNRLLRFYGTTNEQAVAHINTMTADELYDDLISRLPTRETRAYVARVKQMKAQYAAML